MLVVLVHIVIYDQPQLSVAADDRRIRQHQITQLLCSPRAHQPVQPALFLAFLYTGELLSQGLLDQFSITCCRKHLRLVGAIGINDLGIKIDFQLQLGSHETTVALADDTGEHHAEKQHTQHHSAQTHPLEAAVFPAAPDQTFLHRLAYLSALYRGFHQLTHILPDIS